MQKRLTIDDADSIMKLNEVGFSNSEIARCFRLKINIMNSMNIPVLGTSGHDG